MICLLCDEYSVRKEFDAAPWRHLARKVSRFNIPGEHGTCITTHVDVLCERLNEVLSGNGSFDSAASTAAGIPQR